MANVCTPVIIQWSCTLCAGHVITTTLYQAGDGEFVDHSSRPVQLWLGFLLSPACGNSVDLQDISGWQGAADLQGRYFRLGSPARSEQQHTYIGRPSFLGNCPKRGGPVSVLWVYTVCTAYPVLP